MKRIYEEKGKEEDHTFVAYRSLCSLNMKKEKEGKEEAGIGQRNYSGPAMIVMRAAPVPLFN